MPSSNTVSSAVQIDRLSKVTPEALALLQEYYEAVSVEVRDTPDSIQAMVDGHDSGIWVARMNGELAGCVALRSLPGIPRAAECKRLYVRSAARGRRLATQLMDALEDFARDRGLHWIYLDSKDDLPEAIALYRRRGYADCGRYNDNPQATVFLRKHLMEAHV